MRQGRRHQSARRSAPERNRNRPLGGSTAPCAPRRVVGMAADPRSTFFAEAALHTTGGTGSSADLSGDGAMQRFLEDAACPVLVASCPDGGKVQLSNAVDSAALAASQRPTLVFIKTRPVAINTGNMLTVVTSSTLQSSPLESLAAALAHVYAPLVKEQSGPQAGRLQTVLSELRSGLASELRLKGVSSAGQFNEDDASAVQSPADEFNLWTELAARGAVHASDGPLLDPDDCAWFVEQVRFRRDAIQSVARIDSPAARDAMRAMPAPSQRERRHVCSGTAMVQAGRRCEVCDVATRGQSDSPARCCSRSERRHGHGGPPV